MAIAPDRIARFSRHIVLPEVGGAGQVALGKAHLVLIGLGGIGSPALQYLAASGIGKLTLVDDDTVDLSNLQRQTIYASADVGQPKVERASSWLQRFDDAIGCETVSNRIDTDNAAGVVTEATLVLDGCDNFATRLAVSDACVAAGVPLVSAAVGRFQGQVGAFAGHLPGHACYRCLVGDAFDADDCDTCADDGMLGAMAGWVGTFAAMQAIRVILDGKSALGDPQWGKLHVLDGMTPALRTMRIPPDPGCRACSAISGTE